MIKTIQNYWDASSIPPPNLREGYDGTLKAYNTQTYHALAHYILKKSLLNANREAMYQEKRQRELDRFLENAFSTRRDQYPTKYIENELNHLLNHYPIDPPLTLREITQSLLRKFNPEIKIELLLTVIQETYPDVTTDPFFQILNTIRNDKSNSLNSEILMKNLKDLNWSAPLKNRTT